MRAQGFGVAAVLIGVSVVLSTVLRAQDHGKGFTVQTPGDMEWRDGPPSLPAGARLAVLEGDPSRPGRFVMRVRLPDGYRVPPHTHPAAERVTVLSGTFHIAMGSAFDESKGKTMPAGSYGMWEAGMAHYAWVTGETVIQLHGNGPWSIQYINPADDPRHARR
jgi:hypothetical protein